MGKKIFAVVLFLAAALLFFYFFFPQEVTKTLKLPGIKKSDPTPTFFPVTETAEAIFVPYWTLANTNNQPLYSRFIYFGITVDENGINQKESGFTRLENFLSSYSSNEKLLTIRMLDSDINFKILKNKNLQQKIINEVVELALNRGFSGVVLDLELFSLFNDEIPNQINSFVSDFSRASKSNSLHFAMTLYGDTYYRLRPFDTKTLSNYVDEVMIMSYDFSKSYGEPGPNFPLQGREIYGYDMSSMINDFASDFPREKITVIFGYFGYDWTVDEKQRPIKPADPLSYNEIIKKYIDSCGNNCKISRDKTSQETSIKIGDHTIWFEDTYSVKKKQDYLKSKGIGDFAYWASGYF